MSLKYLQLALGGLEAWDGQGGCRLRTLFSSSLLSDGTGPSRSLSLKLSDTTVCKPQIRARLGTTAHLCKVVDHLQLALGGLEARDGQGGC